jgi:hypothetical protein
MEITIKAFNAPAAVPGFCRKAFSKSWQGRPIDFDINFLQKKSYSVIDLCFGNITRAGFGGAIA